MSRHPIRTLFLFLLVSHSVAGQIRNKASSIPCDNWLNTPSTNSFVRIGDLDVPGNKITVEATINRTQPYLPGGGDDTEGDVVSKHTDPSDANYILRPNHAWITTSNGFFGTPDICDLELNKTYHIAMVYDGATLKFYRNGFLMSQVNATGNLVQTNLQTQIGHYAATFWNTQFLGYINEVRIWNIARTQAEIRAYMNASLPNPTTQTGLLAYYTFDNLLNKQGNPTWNGTLFNGASINNTNTNCTFFADSCARTNISNVINTYTPVLALNPCNNKITVEDASTFNVGDTVLMIQMKGADINTTNTASFGSVTNYNNAGNYEFNYVKSKTGNIIELKNTLIRQYNIPTGKVQLIRVPYYQNATVTSTLTCLPWDGNKGGVLVLNVLDSVTLNANIDVSGLGFRGGTSPNPNTTTLYCFRNEYFYPLGDQGAADKGESISILNNNIAWGKGSPANGGGGGNGHNSGGGGGANGNTGGFGGYQLLPCGSAPYDNRGIGGHVLNYSNAANKIYLGGGGGSGHTDNAGGSNMPGGNGGGIIIVRSNYIKANSFKIISNGSNAPQCVSPPASDCHDGSGGGGAGGTILIQNNNYIDPVQVEAKGGKGGDLTIYNPPAGADKIGPGGGGSGGVVWLSNPSNPANVTQNLNFGVNGVIIPNANDPWGATAGQAGTGLFNLVIPVTTVLFKPNIDSVRIKDSLTSCSSFDFKGFGYTNTNPVAGWQWYFGDGGQANTQNTSHTYSTAGTYTVKLVVTDINGCKDSIMKDVVAANALDFDFNYDINACNPLSVQFTGAGTSTINPYWSFGDGGTSTGSTSAAHLYALPGIYIVKYSLTNGACTDTVTKTIDVSVTPANVVLTNDTTICKGSTKQLLTSPALSFCWTPTTFLDNPNSPNPITSTPGTITYYFTSQSTGTNVITDGNFNNGNTGFTSQYIFANPNTTEGQYFVGSSPQAWNASLSNCSDHTTGSGNMMLINGSPTPNVSVWQQTVTVTPNTNYAFSTWIQALWPPNPAQLQFSINGRTIGAMITASLPTCTWTQFFTTWNSGNNSSATISIVNKNTAVQGNDFALDDISFAPVFIKRDSVIVSVDTARITTNNDTTICTRTPVQLNTTGAQTYSWTPAATLNNPLIANPVATPVDTTQYIVTGTNIHGCVAKDTVNVFVFPKPAITTSNDTTICLGGTAQLFVTGGNSYSWTPATTLNNPSSPTPVATPADSTMYYVTITDLNTCRHTDSVKVDVRSLNSFSVDLPPSFCKNGSVQLHAHGGDLYLWSPGGATVSNPIVSPATTTMYQVLITDTVCRISNTLSTVVTVLPLPTIDAHKSNDIDCSTPQSQLVASGAATYSWTPAGTLTNPNSGTTIARPTVTTLYTVNGSDAFGCVNYDTITVNVINVNKSGYWMPTGFTPNNDGLNDCYGVKQWGTILEIDFSIYNRWGERIFHSTKPGDCWDGRHKGLLQDAAVFVYMITAKTTCEGKIFRKGTFTLIR